MKLQDIPAALAVTREAGRFRRVEDLRMVTATRGLMRDGKEYIVFHSNDYLGMTHEEEVIDAARRAISYGTGSGGARLTSGAVFELSDLEQEIADFKHAEDAVIFNTGYMTNLGVLYALAGKDDLIFSDALNHASIVDGCRISKAKTIVYAHSDIEDLERKLADTPCDGQRFIITDGVFSMDGDIAPLPALLRLKKKYSACLIVDDAHGLGVIGDTGRGTAEYFHEEGIDIQIGTLSKALGAEGGYAAASQEITAYLRNHSRPFIFSTSIAAPTGAAALAALRLLRKNPDRFTGRLHRNTAYLKDKLTAAGIPLLPGDTSIIPLILGQEEKALAAAKAAKQAGLLLSAIRPPTVPKGTSRLRLTVTAAHTVEELDRAAEVMGKLGIRDKG